MVLLTLMSMRNQAKHNHGINETHADRVGGSWGENKISYNIESNRDHMMLLLRLLLLQTTSDHYHHHHVVVVRSITKSNTENKIQQRKERRQKEG